MSEVHISTDPSKLDVDLIHAYLSKESYWAGGRSKEDVILSINHSLCFGIYLHDKQIGFARVVTDYTNFAYLADVFVLTEYRKKGLSIKLIGFILDHPQLAKIKRWMLGTRDAHELYKKFGFSSPAHPDRWMEKVIQ